MTDADALVNAILARGNLALSPEEVAALEAADPSHVQARKILCAHAFNTGDFARAARLAREVFEAAPLPENAANLVSALSRAGDLEAAIAFTSDPDVPLDDVLRASHLSEFHGRKGAVKEGRKWARQALKLKEREARIIAKRPAPIKARFNPETPERNVISYSLFGDKPRYLEGALRNAIVARHLYPGWTPRFYIDERVPMETRAALEHEGAVLKQVPKLPADRFGLFWRFLVEDDPNVDIYLVRDADSVPNIREAAAVADWLRSGKPFHVMRDYVTHSELVLAGMWGAHRGNVPGMGKRILSFAKAREGVLNSRVDDQIFLRREIWPWMRGRVFVQDSAFGYGESAAFDARFKLPGDMHIGQDDYVARSNRRGLAAVARAQKTGQAPA